MPFPQRSLWVLLVASLGLGACEVSPEIASEGGSTISCALGGATDFTGECRLVEVGDGSANYLIMRHPDGGFRRLARAETVSGLAEFDGARDTFYLCGPGEFSDSMAAELRGKFGEGVKVVYEPWW